MSSLLSQPHPDFEFVAPAPVYRAIRTTFAGPTNTRGSRVIASNGDRRCTFDWDHALNPTENHRAAAQAFADLLQWHGPLVGGTFGDAYYWTFAERTWTAEGN